MAKITASDVRLLLRDRYSDSRRYAYAEEVYNATGLEASAASIWSLSIASSRTASRSRA